MGQNGSSPSRFAYCKSFGEQGFLQRRWSVKEDPDQVFGLVSASVLSTSAMLAWRAADR